MYELEKIKEAEYFYNQILKTEEDSEAFKYNLSAFLSAARSVLQFAREEAITKSKGQYWYDTCVSKKPIISFFKDKRDINIHREPVKTIKDITLSLTEALHLSVAMGPIRMVHKDKYGKIISESISENQSEPEPRKVEKQVPPKVTYRYRFDNWTGNEDIPTLCRQYLDELKIIAIDGKKKGFLS
jgi:hypothetical protein